MSTFQITHTVTLADQTVTIPVVPIPDTPRENTLYMVPFDFEVEVPFLERKIRLATERATFDRVPSEAVGTWLVRVAEQTSAEALACFDRGENTSGLALLGLTHELLREAGAGR